MAPMRGWVALLFVALSASPLPAAEPAPVRIVIVHEGELLGSESKALAELEKKLSKKTVVKLGDATPSETAAARACLGKVAPSTPGPLPPEWLGAETVVVLEVLPPAGKKPNRITRGLGSVLVFRPPQPQPIYVEQVDGNADVALRADTLGEWLARAMAITAKAAP